MHEVIEVHSRRLKFAFFNRTKGNVVYKRQQIKLTWELVSKTVRIKDKVGVSHMDRIVRKSAM